jgi:hypothetical protein
MPNFFQTHQVLRELKYVGRRTNRRTDKRASSPIKKFFVLRTEPLNS